MRSMILAIAAGALACATVGADAMPAGTMSGAGATPVVTLVSGGCGPARHPNGYGVCVRNYVRPAYGYYGPGYVRPYARCGVRVGPLGIGLPC